MGHPLYHTMFTFYLLLCLKKNVKKLLKNFEYAKLQKAKKFSVPRLNIKGRFGLPLIFCLRSLRERILHEHV